MSDISLFIITNIFPLLMLAVIFGVSLLWLFHAGKSHYLIYFFLAWLPLETLFLKYSPSEYYNFIKYGPELLLYAALAVAYARFIWRERRWWPADPISKWLAVFLVVSVLSLLLNRYDVYVWALGLRQLLRFMSVYFLIIMENYSAEQKHKLLLFGLGMVIFESILAVAQYATRGALDQYLFFGNEISVGNATIIGIEQFWAPGTRAFATLGRYDRLAGWLALSVAILFPWRYVIKDKSKIIKFWIVFGLVMLALLLSYSRAGMLAAGVGICAVGLWIMKDEALKRFLAILAVAGLLYLGLFAILQGSISDIVDRPAQPLSERLLEAVSPRSWKASYNGYGRIFFIVNVPTMVVTRFPLFGVGLGRFGDGVASALGDQSVYTMLHLPFGVQNTYGQIDNNWFSIWAGVGTVGVICWAMILILLLRFGYRVSGNAVSVETRSLGRGLVGATVAVMVLGFFAPYFEFRVLMFYFWAYAGLVVSSDNK
ncbi:MAG: O-antigen ligase family protein [bacterium]|nr:O-antigen ligase family protein [bacterium]